MEKEKILSSKKIVFLFFIFSIFIHQSSFSQCPVPKDVDISVGKCASDFPKVSELSASGTDVSSVIEWFLDEFGGVALDPNQTLESGDYWVQQTIDDCISNRVSTTVTIYNPEISAIETEQKICYTSMPTIADLIPSSNILWYDSDYVEGSEDLGTPLMPSVELVNEQTYWAAQYNFPCESTTRIETTVKLEEAPYAGTDGLYPSCEIDLVDTDLYLRLLDSPDAGGTWTDPNGNTHSGNFVAGTDIAGVYTYTVAGGAICPEDTAIVTVTITVVPPPTTTETNQSFCEINAPTIADLSTSGNSVLWYDTETSTTPLNDTDLLVDSEDYWASQTDATSGCESATRLVVTVAIITPSPPTTTETNQSFCEIDAATVTDLSATGNAILWYDTETSVTPLNDTDLLINSEDYWASQTDATSGCESATRLVVTVTIITPSPPTTTETNQSFCKIDAATVADLSATGNAILWYDSETSVTPLNDTDLLVDSEGYWASQTDATSGCESATRLVVTVTIITTFSPTTTETNQSFCEIDAATVADLSATGNAILWYDTETSTTSLNDIDALIDGEDYWASQTDAVSGCESATRLVVTVTIIIPSPPTTTETSQSFCIIDFSPNNPTIADLNASGNAILWYDTEASTTPLNDTDDLIDGEDYWASQTDATSGCESATRLVLTVAIITPSPPTTTETNQSFCEIDAATVADLSATGNAILWYNSETSVTPLNDTDLLVDSEDYWASQTDATSGCESATRLVVTVTIITASPPTTTETNQSFCEIDTATVANLRATGNAILWYDTETSTTPLNDTDALIDGEDYWASQTNATSGCESAIRLVVTVTITTPSPPTTTETSQSFCIIDFLPNSPTIADLNASGNAVLWYDSETSTTPLNNTDALVDGEDYWASQTDATSGCESATRLVINVSIINPTAPTTSETNQAFCLAESPTVLDLQADGETILWFDAETSTTPLNDTDALVDGEDYWAAASNATTGCESIIRIMVTVTINDILPATITSISQSFCASDSPTIEDLQATGNDIIWYASETETIPLDTTEILIDGENYWAAQTDATSGCVSSLRVNVTVTLTDPGIPDIIALGSEFCIIDKPTVADLNANVSALNSGTITWYDSFPNGVTISLSEMLVEGETYYAIESDMDGCSSISPLAVTVTLDSCDEYDVEIYDGFSPTGNGINDTFKLGNLRELYPDFKVEFFNRWGNLVYTTNNSKPDWNGRLNGDGELAPAGVYYFIINFNKNSRKSMQRRLYLSR